MPVMPRRSFLHSSRSAGGSRSSWMYRSRSAESGAEGASTPAGHEPLQLVLRGQGPHGAVVRAGQRPGRGPPQGRLAHPLLVGEVARISRQVHQGRREEGVPRPGGVHDLDLEGRDAAAELPGGVEGSLGTPAYQDEGDAAVYEDLRGLFDALHAEQRRELVVAQLDDGGEVEQRVHGLAGGLDARPEVLAEVDVEGRRDVEVLRELRGPVDRRAAGVFYEEYAPEVDERSPGQELFGDVFRPEKLVGGRVRAVEGEGSVPVFSDLHEGQRGARGRLAPPDRRGVHSFGLQRTQDKVPEEILPYAPRERRLLAEPSGGYGD